MFCTTEQLELCWDHFHIVTAAKLVSQNIKMVTMLVNYISPMRLKSLSSVLINLHSCLPRECKGSLTTSPDEGFQVTSQIFVRLSWQFSSTQLKSQVERGVVTGQCRWVSVMPIYRTQWPGQHLIPDFLMQSSVCQP